MKLFEDLNIKYQNKIIADNLTINFSPNTMNIVLMPNNAGKTVLAKHLESDHNYLIKEYLSYPEDINALKYLISKTARSTINKELIIELLKEFNLPKDIMKNNISDLSEFEQIIIEIIINNISKRQVLVIDNKLLNLKVEERKKLWSYLIKSKQTVIYFTHNINTILNNKKNHYYFVNYGHLLGAGDSKILFNQKLFKDNSLELPFYIKLSNYLKLYNLIIADYLTKEDLGDAL